MHGHDRRSPGQGWPQGHGAVQVSGGRVGELSGEPSGHHGVAQRSNNLNTQEGISLPSVLVRIQRFCYFYISTSILVGKGQSVSLQIFLEVYKIDKKSANF